MTTMKKICFDDNSMDCLVLGTKDNLVYVLSPPNFSIIEKVIFISLYTKRI